MVRVTHTALASRASHTSQGYEIPKGVGGVFLVIGANGRPNGEAFVEFGSEEIADAAMAKVCRSPLHARASSPFPPPYPAFACLTRGSRDHRHAQPQPQP